MKNVIMRYNIENKVIFFPESNILKGTGDNSGIEDELARPTSRLLLALIIRKNTMITRDELLDIVWSDYGGIPSGSNLNNHLTLLRKRFDFWGVSRNTIVTVPRKGVIFRAAVYEEDADDADVPSVLCTKQPGLTLFPDPQETVTNTEDIPVPVLDGKRFPRDNHSGLPVRAFYTGMTGLFILLAFTFYHGFQLPPAPGERMFFQLKQCHVFPVKTGFILSNEESYQILQATLEKKVDDKKISCDEPKDLYVAMRPYQNENYLYVSECKYRSPSTYTTCLGYLFPTK